MPKRQYESIDDAAIRLGVNPRTVRRRIADGTITGYRVGGLKSIRVACDEIDDKLLQPIPTVNGAA
jgi:excisionase family DNA binding protein